MFQKHIFHLEAFVAKFMRVLESVLNSSHLSSFNANRLSVSNGNGILRSIFDICRTKLSPVGR